MMRAQAIGNNATVELYDHHLVIRRHPGFLEASATELLVPLANIVSVQFRRPALLTSGRLIVSLQGAAQPKRTSYERRADQTSITFEKGQHEQFEQILEVIRETIATPSIEQMAMGAQRDRQERVAQARPKPQPTRAVVEQVGPPHQSSYNPSTGADYHDTGSDGHWAYHNPGQRRDDRPPLNPSVGNWWHEVHPLGKIFLMGIPLIFVLAMCSGSDIRPDQDPTGDAASLLAPAADSSPAQAPSPAREEPSVTPSVPLEFNAIADHPAENAQCEGETWTPSGANGEDRLDWFPDDSDGLNYSLSFRYAYDGKRLRLFDGRKFYNSGAKAEGKVKDRVLTLLHMPDGSWSLNGHRMEECAG